MVKLTKIYTKGGDKGETSLGDGSRVKKHNLRVEAFGAVDEANAALGIARLYTRGKVHLLLGRIQNDLFDLGADLCRPESKKKTPEQQISESQVEKLEAEIDAVNAKLAPLTSFVLPGGTPASSFLHLARTLARRAERLMFALAEKEPVNPAALRYINRLSDLLFVLARHQNDKGRGDVLWRPGANR